MEGFEEFLKLLSNGSDPDGRCYERLHQKLTGFFSMKGLSDPASCADETIDRAILKIRSGAVVPDIERYCFGIARNLCKEKLRLLRRETTAFHNFLDDLSRSSAEQVERIYQLLKPCFEELNGDEQLLLVSYCREQQDQSRAEHRRQLAETLKIPVQNLRVRVNRLRKALDECVQRRTDNL